MSFYCPVLAGRPRRWLTDSKLLSFSCPKESHQRKRHPETCWDFQSQSPHIKIKTGVSQSRAMLRIFRPQTNARYDPVLVLMLGCV